MTPRVGVNAVPVTGCEASYRLVSAFCCREAMVSVVVGNFTESVGGICVGVEGEDKYSARESKIPPTTKMTETMRDDEPTPNWRIDFIIRSPCSYYCSFSQWAKAH